MQITKHDVEDAKDAMQPGDIKEDVDAAMTSGKKVDPRIAKDNAESAAKEVLRKYIVKMGHKDPGDGASLVSLQALAHALKLDSGSGGTDDSAQPTQ